MATFPACYRYGMEQSERPAQHVANRAATDAPFFSKLNADAYSVAADDSQEVAAGYPCTGHFVNGFLRALLDVYHRSCCEVRVLAGLLRTSLEEIRVGDVECRGT